MIRLLQIMVLSSLLFLLTGCNGSEKDDTLWQNLKIGDLAPSHSVKRPGGQSLKTMNFNVYIFEIPAENISALDDIWQVLYTKPLQFNDYDAFVANSFLVGFGQIRMWNKIADLLRAAGGKKIQTVSLLLPDGQANDLTITRLNREQTIFYVSTDGSMAGATIGPGQLALRIKAEKIPGLRGVCSVNAQPVFASPITSSILQLAARAKSGEFLFTSAGFGLKMGPGDFFLLGPEKYIDHQITLGSLFFSKPEGSLFLSESEGRPFLSKPERKPAIRVFLLVCTSIND